jgi:hypothetical protein
MVGAGRFERPTPCAQGMLAFDGSRLINCFDSICCGRFVYGEESGL